MIQSNGNDHRRFEQAAVKLLPILEKLKTEKTKIIWYHQAPVLLMKNGLKQEIHSTKMVAYNNIAQSIFKYAYS